jgi:hypothetical protein
MFSARWSPAARCGILGLFGGFALACVLGNGRSPLALAQAQAAPVAGEAAGTIAFTSGGPGAGQWLYLVDTRNQAFAVYRVDPQDPKGVVKLEAARQYRWDLRLAEYNNRPPDVGAIESMVAHPKR